MLEEHARVARNFRGVRYLGGRAEQIDFDDRNVLAALAVLWLSKYGGSLRKFQE